MQIINDRCCGLDVRKSGVLACVLHPAGKEVRAFGASTSGLLALADWLTSLQVSVVAAEGTKTLLSLVQDTVTQRGIDLIVVSDRLRSVPGRDAEASDAEWLADMLRHGLVKGG